MPEQERQHKSSSNAAFDNTYGHVQPQATDVERVVLGALMTDEDAYSLVSDIIRPETFYEPRNRKIYEAIQSLNMSDRPVDIMTVTDELKKEGALDAVGGPSYIIELSYNVASSAHVVSHAEILADKFLARQLISFSNDIQTKAFSQAVDVKEIVQEAESGLFELSRNNMRRDYMHVGAVISIAEKILQRASSSSTGLTGVPTGYAKLDEKTSGWQNSDLVVIAGRPAMGKTSLALSIAKNAAVDYQIPTAFFSLEMSNVQLVNRLISNVCEIPGSKMLNGQLSPDEWERFDKNLGRLQSSPLFLDDTPGLSIFELRTKARRLVREKGVKLLIIDYIGLMNANGMHFSNRQEEVSKISQSLKSLARELDIPVLALAQLNRNLTAREGIMGKRPQLSDLRESGAIEQDADMVLLVHRPEYYHIYNDENGNDLRGMAEIIVAKHRKGSTGDVMLRFRGEYTCFQDADKGGSYIDDEPFGSEIIGSKINGGGNAPIIPISMDMDEFDNMG